MRYKVIFRDGSWHEFESEELDLTKVPPTRRTRWIVGHDCCFRCRDISAIIKVDTAASRKVGY